MYPSPKSGIGCRCRYPWRVSRVEGDLGDDEDALPLALLTLPKAATICFGLSFRPLGIVIIPVLSLENEFARLEVVGRGGVAVPAEFTNVGEVEAKGFLAGGGVARLEAGDAAAILSSTCLTSGGIGTLKTVFTAFQSTAEIILNSEGWGALQQPGQPLLASGSFC
jgi:hypothetical protein